MTRTRTLSLAGVLLLAFSIQAWSATGTVMPSPKFYCLDNNGAIVSGGKLFTYASGTTTKLDTYTDATLATPNANPVVCDSSGQATVFLSATAYKFTFAPSTDTDPPTAAYWTVDNVGAVAYISTDLDVLGTAGEALSASDAVYVSDGSGGLTAGRWYKTDSDNTYSSTLPQAVGFAPSAIASAAAGSIRMSGRLTGLAGLTPGSTYYVSATPGAITSTAPANQRILGVADSATSLVIATSVLTPASATAAGIVSLAARTLGSGVKTFTSAPVFNAPATFRPGASASADATISGRVSTNTTTVGNVGAGEDDLMSYSLLANALDANGKLIRILTWGDTAGNANNKQLKAYFGATNISLFNGGFNAALWHAEVYIVRTGAATQVLKGTVWMRYGGVPDVYSPAVATPAETLSGAVTIKFTGEATTNDDIRQQGMIVEVIG